jgi:hypothetical protein
VLAFEDAFFSIHLRFKGYFGRVLFVLELEDACCCIDGCTGTVLFALALDDDVAAFLCCIEGCTGADVDGFTLLVEAFPCSKDG